MAFVAPGGRCGFDRLLRRVTSQVFTRSRQVKVVLIERGFADEQFEKPRSFEPPMPKQLRVKGSDNDWIAIDGRKLPNLQSALFEEMLRVGVGCFFGRSSIVQILFTFTAGDAVIFHAGKFAQTAGHRAEMLHRKIKADVAIKLPISRIAGIPFLRAPNLPTRIAVARESGWAGQRVAGGVNRVARSWVPKEQAVRVEDEPANICFLQERFEAWRVTAFG